MRYIYQALQGASGRRDGQYWVSQGATEHVCFRASMPPRRLCLVLRVWEQSVWTTRGNAFPGPADVYGASDGQTPSHKAMHRTVQTRLSKSRTCCRTSIGPREHRGPCIVVPCSPTIPLHPMRVLTRSWCGVGGQQGNIILRGGDEFRPTTTRLDREGYSLYEMRKASGVLRIHDLEQCAVLHVGL